MNLIDRRNRIQHRLMAIGGGFLGAYAILIHNDVFGNAMTSNCINLVLEILGKNPREVLYRVLGVLLYILATALVVILNHHCMAWTKTIGVLINMMAVIVLALLPREIPVVIGLYPIFFAMAFQWSAFPGAYGYVSSSIFSTNNVKQTTISFTEYLYTKDKKQLHRALFFLGSLLCFHVGVVVAYFGVKYLETKASLVLLPYYIGCLIFIWHKE